MKIKKLAIPALLLLLLAAVGCQKNEAVFDIRGQWTFNDGDTTQGNYTFIGTPESGTLVDTPAGENGTVPAKGLLTPRVSGTYAVTGKDVVFDFTSTLLGGRNCHFSGSFVAEGKLQGTMDLVGAIPPGSWSLQVEGRKQ